MATRKSVSQAKQKFLTGQLQKGCNLVAFYNHTDHVFTEDEIGHLIGKATEAYGNIGWQTSGGAPIQYYVWVDIGGGTTQVGIALSGDQIPCGFNEFQGEDMCTILKGLETHSQGWKSRDDLIHTLEGQTSIMDRLV